jgi:hypothetical protein
MGISSNSIESGIGSDLSRMHVKRYQLFCRRLALSLLPPPTTAHQHEHVASDAGLATPRMPRRALLDCPG